MNTLELPIHEPQILRMVPVNGESGLLASVTLCYGPVAIRAKLVNGNQGMFLSMPSHKGNDERWWDQAYFRDRSVHDLFEQLAKRHYEQISTQKAA